MVGGFINIPLGDLSHINFRYNNVTIQIQYLYGLQEGLPNPPPPPPPPDAANLLWRLSGCWKNHKSLIKFFFSLGNIFAFLNTYLIRICNTGGNYSWHAGEPVPAAAGYAQGGGGARDGASLRAVLLQPRQEGQKQNLSHFPNWNVYQKIPFLRWHFERTTLIFL